MKKSTRLPMLMSLVAVAGLLSLPLTALAVQPVPTPPGDHLNITEVEVNFDTSMIVITGEHFSFGNTLEVTLGEFGPLDIVGVPSDMEIMVDFPAGGLPAGEYLLTVSTGIGQSQNDEYDLTVVQAVVATVCPCEELSSSDGTTWNNSFVVEQCTTNGQFDIAVLTIPNKFLQVQWPDGSGEVPKCTIQSLGADPEFIQLDLSEYWGSFLACYRSLQDIAAADGCECNTGSCL